MREAMKEGQQSRRRNLSPAAWHATKCHFVLAFAALHRSLVHPACPTIGRSRFPNCVPPTVGAAHRHPRQARAYRMLARKGGMTHVACGPELPEMTDTVDRVDLMPPQQRNQDCAGRARRLVSNEPFLARKR